jgi:hypothetical protein
VVFGIHDQGIGNDVPDKDVYNTRMEYTKTNVCCCKTAVFTQTISVHASHFVQNGRSLFLISLLMSIYKEPFQNYFR